MTQHDLQPKTRAAGQTPWRVLGSACQAIVLGVLLFLATAKLLTLSLGATAFTYQGF